MSAVQSSAEIFRKTATQAESARKVECKPLRRSTYVENGRSIVALIRAEDRTGGIVEALRLLGGIEPAIKDLGEGYVLIKPNCNSYDPFPASTHPDTLKLVLELLLKAGLKKEQILIGDMSGPGWLPTETTKKERHSRCC